MAPVLAVTLSLLILEPDMPTRKAPHPARTAPAPAAAQAAARKGRQPQASPDPAAAALLQALNPHAAGIDVGTTELWVAFPPGTPLPPPPPGHPDNLPANVRRFGTFTADLEALAAMLHGACRRGPSRCPPARRRGGAAAATSRTSTRGSGCTRRSGWT